MAALYLMRPAASYTTPWDTIAQTSKRTGETAFALRVGFILSSTKSDCDLYILIRAIRPLPSKSPLLACRQAVKTLYLRNLMTPERHQ
jgi:hypothetical protein